MSQSLPQWCLDAMAEAGLSAEGWRESHRFDYRVIIDGFSVQLWIQPNGRITAEFDPLPLPDAFRLASRLAAALEGQPCPKCAELRAENERLRGALGRVVKSGDDLYLGISIHNNRKKDCRVEGPVIEIHRKELKVAREALSPTEQTQENEPK